MPSALRTCSCCGLAQTLPPVPAGMRAACARCDSNLRKASRHARSNSRAAAIAVAALILYPLAVTMPILKVARMGHHTESSILSGITTLLADGEILVGLIVLLCSVVFPLFKLISLLMLSSGAARAWLAHRHRALTYHLIEWTGRWGMLDVLLVAILVAALKLGDMVEVHAGPAAAAFAACVTLSLIATACFDPHQLWETVDE